MSDIDRPGPRKPTGLTGSVHMSFDASPPLASLRPFEFPASKAEIESLVAEQFLKAAAVQAVLDFAVTGFSKNPTDDYDFTLSTSTGQRYLELLEVAPPEYMKAGHLNAPATYSAYDFARSVTDKIMAKSDRYDSMTASRTILLLYETHWAFAGSPQVLLLLRYFVFGLQPRFEEIHWYHPIAPGDGISEFVYPTPADHWMGFDPESMREGVVHNLDPREWKTGGG